METVDIRGYENRPFDKRAAADLEAMLADAEAAGCKLYLVSGYRSVERQTALFKRKTNSFMAEGFSREEAEKQAAMWVARPAPRSITRALPQISFRRTGIRSTAT